MKSILVHAADDGAMQSRMEVALDIARVTGAHLTFLQSVSYEVFAPGDFYGSAMAAALPKIKEAAEQFRAKTEADLSNEDVAWDWKFLDGMAEDRLLEQSALYDMVIVGPHDIGEGGKRPSRMAGELALKAPLPVLVVPEGAGRFDITKPILAAWNGSSEAAVALRMAVPMMQHASKVFLACVSEEGTRDRHDFRLDDGAKYLSRHDIEAEIVEIPSSGEKVSDLLFAAAEMRDCSMVVMGAYGHSRLAEMLFGGVTRRSLTDPQMPIFLAH